MSGLHRLRVTELHPNLLCILCGGYYVDATTIVECLHSFCKTCIVRYLESSKFCPICDVQVHKTKPLLSIRPDKTLQDIVYKLVPGLYQNEMCRRRDFYASHPEADPLTPEDGGKDLGRWYILPDDPVSVALHPAPSSYNPKYFNLRSMSAPTHTCPSAKMSMDESKTPHLLMKKDGSHVRYLQCPAGVSIAQLKRLLRAKFGVGPSHPLAVLTCTSEDPLSDTLTLVDVAYITSWQKTEPLQLQYRIYERASKKIKLDPESLSSEALNSNEEMPKLEPSVGNGANISAYASLDAAGNVLEYRCAPLLQAFETNDCDTSLKKDEEKWQTETGKGTAEAQATSCKDCAADALAVAAAKPEEVAAPEESCKAPVTEEKTESVQPELTQGNGGENGSEAKTDTGGGGGVESCDSNLQKVTNVTDGNNIVDAYLTYDRAYAAAPSNGVNVGVTFIPSEVGYISPAGVPCTIIPSGSCVSVSGECIPGGVGVPTAGAAAAAVCSGAALHRPLQGEAGTTDHVNVWVAAGLQNLVSEPALLTVENKPSAVDMKDGEDEGKEVQLTISESGIMSASGRGTTVEGMVNAIESEACELLSKIESGSIGEDFPPKAGEQQVERETSAEPSNVISKQSKVKDNISVPVDSVKNKVDGKGNANNKNQVCLKGEKSKVVTPPGNVSAVTLKPNTTTGPKDSKGAVNEKTETEAFPDNVAKKSISESQDKTSEKRTIESRRPSDTQQPMKDSREVSNAKDARSTHIPASLTAASMANLNKPHLKAGPSKLSQVEEVKSQDTKPGNNGVNVRKEGKQDQSGKQLLSGGCRKSSQPYGYRTLKTPPKSWNPTISREQLALGAGKSSSGKGLQEHVRPNKFFKNRNNPRFLGNPSAGVRPMFANVNDNSSNQQKRGVVLKLDPKTLGPVPVPVSNDIRSSGCLTSVSSSTSSVSSGQSATISTTQTTMSLVGSLPMSSDGHTAISSLQTCNMEAAVAVAAPRVEDTPVTSTKGSPTLPTSLKSVAKESTNSSSKVIGKLNTTVQESKMIHDTVKTTSSSSSSSSSSNIGSKVNNKISATAKSESMSIVQTAVSNSKVDISGQSVIVKEDRANTGTTVQVVSTVGNMVPNSNLPKPALSTAIPTCVTQLRAATINTLTPPNTSFQPQQHFTVGSPAVGIIPSSCGVSLPATIGTMPLPYYTSPSLGYPTYPFVYQSPDATIGLIPTHPSASFIPTFSSCLSPRSPLSPRNIGGTKMLPDLPLQSNLLPLVPLVPQVPPQALSPRPMTPPSPRTPTSNQSPKPYPTQSPRQSSTNHSRPQTPHSPKTLISTGHTRSPVQSPKLPAGQSVKPQSGSQLTPTITQPLTQTQTSGTQVTSSSQSPNLASKLNACVQTSFSHTTIMPKNNMSFIPSKPSVPLPTKNALPSQSLGLSQQQVVSVSSCYPNTSQSPKPSRPKMPQSPKLTSSVGCTLPSETLIRTGSTTQPVRPPTPQFAKCSTPSYSAGDTRTTSVSTPRMTVTSQDRLQIAIPQSPVFTMPLPVSQFTTAVSSGVSVTGLPVPQMSNSLDGTAMFHPQTLQVSIPHTMSAISHSVNGTGNTSMTAVSKVTGNLPEVFSTVSSFIPNSSSASLLYPHNSVQNIPPVLTTSNMTPISAVTSTPACISAVPSCTSLTQNFPFNSNASCVNPMISPSIPPPGHIPSNSAAETPKISSVMPVVVSVGNVAVSLSGNNNTSSKVSVNNTVSTSCPAVTGASHDVTRSVTSAVSVSSSVNSLPTNACTSVSLPHSTATFSVPACLGTTTISSTTPVTPPGMLAVTSTNNKVEEFPHKTSSPIDVHKSSVANTISLSTTASVAISPCITGSFAVPLNGTTDVVSSQCKTLNTPDSMAKSSLSPSSGSGVLNPSGSSDMGGKSVVMNARERGGNMPQPSACTPVCDVTHVIDAKLQCAEPSVGSSDGPRPCLKS